jgi:hypothetical protein
VSGASARREILISPPLPMHDHTRIRAAGKLIERTCDSEKEWRFGPPVILSRMTAAVFRLFFE